jgi:hypothetical protein
MNNLFGCFFFQPLKTAVLLPPGFHGFGWQIRLLNHCSTVGKSSSQFSLNLVSWNLRDFFVSIFRSLIMMVLIVNFFDFILFGVHLAFFLV